VFAERPVTWRFFIFVKTRGCIQKFPDWPSGARTANETVLCHQEQFYRSFVSQSSEFCFHNSLCCFSTSVYCCKRIFRSDSVRKLLDILSYFTILNTLSSWRIPRLQCMKTYFKSQPKYLKHQMINSLSPVTGWPTLMTYWF